LERPSLEALGWGPFFADQAPDAPGLPMRVSVAYGRQVDLLGPEGPPRAAVAGLLFHEGRSPVVGDWVRVHEGLVASVLDARTRFVRQAVGRRTEAQVIASNVDVIFVVASATEEFNERRIERYLFAIRASGAEPVIVLNKADLTETPEAFVARLGPLAAEVPVIASSAKRGEVEPLRRFLGLGRTVALVGSSGVGKSTLINALLGRSRQRTHDVRDADAKGRHTTTHRELIVLPEGGVLMDTPGMRELQVWEGDVEGAGFDDLEALAAECRFADCSHAEEPSCAVRAAAEAGQLDPGRLESWQKLQRELAAHRAREDVVGRKAAAKRVGRQVREAKAWRKRRRDGEG
jgi:ribosome biogenesis GTPase